MTANKSLWSKISGSSQFMGAGSVLAGSAAAALHGNFEFLPATLCLLFVFFAQLSGNLYLRLHDNEHNLGGNVDQRIHEATPSIDPAFLSAATNGTGLLAAMIGVALTGMGGWWILIIGALILLISWLTFGGAHPLIRTPYSILSTFILFGPICVITTSYIQSSHEATLTSLWFDLWPAIIMSIPVGLLAINSNLAYCYISMYSHLRNSRSSFATKYGRKNTRRLFLLCSIAAGLIPPLRTIFFDSIQCYLEVGVGLIVTGINIYIWYKMKRLPRYREYEIINLTNFNLFLFGLLELAIYLFAGVPDDSRLLIFSAL